MFYRKRESAEVFSNDIRLLQHMKEIEGWFEKNRSVPTTLKKESDAL